MTIKNWPRVIALADMDAFFASIEQARNPNLIGKPVGITNGIKGTCIITCSYEARAYGVHTGMHIKYAKKLEKLGLAELKITFVDLEGTLKGIDYDYSQKISKNDYIKSPNSGSS